MTDAYPVIHPAQQAAVDSKAAERVGVVSHVVPDGFRADGRARVTLVLRPQVRGMPGGGQDTEVGLRDWPTEVMARYLGSPPRAGEPASPIHGRTVELEIAPYASGRETVPKGDTEPTLKAQIEWKPDAEIGKRIADLWCRMMCPPADRGEEIWADIARSLACGGGNPASVVITTPHAAAAMTYTLAQGRAVLDALARSAPDAIPFREPEVSLDRPWYRGEERLRVASRDGAGFSWRAPAGPRSEEYWIAPYRARMAAIGAGEAPAPLWPAPIRFAEEALAEVASAATLERVRAAHHAATPHRPEYPVCSSEEQRLDTARRRLNALLTLPSLQRLFGFAVDLTLDVDDAFRKAAAAGPFHRLRCKGAGSWTLVRLDASDPDHRFFCLATRKEADHAEAADAALGFRVLGKQTSDRPAYDLITVDPVLATENDINRSAAGGGSAEHPPASGETGSRALRNGGFRLVHYEGEPRPADRCRAVGAPQPLLWDAEDLRAGERLMVGVEIGDLGASAKTLLWRSPDYRRIVFRDTQERKSSSERENWVERELDRRIPDRFRRLQLDGVVAVRSEQQLKDDTVGVDAKTTVRDAALKIIVDSTIAVFGSDPAAAPQAELVNGKTVPDPVLTVVQELEIDRTYAAPSRTVPGIDPRVLSPSLRFGWPYHAMLSDVYAGGISADMERAESACIVRPDLALPARGTGGRRFLRHEPVGAPVALLIAADHAANKKSKLSPPQDGQDMYVRSAPSIPNGSVPTSRRILIPPAVPLQFAMLHDVFAGLAQGAKVPPQGLAGFTLVADPGGDHPGRITPGPGPHGRPYYPDPAASVLVLRLAQPTERGATEPAYFDDVVTVPFGALTWPDGDAKSKQRAWPEVVPVQIALKAVSERDASSRLASLGTYRMGRNGPAVPLGAAEAVHAVEIRLRGGEDVVLHAWCVPTTNQLADWFDAVEAAGVLGRADASRPVGKAGAACVAYVEGLLGTAFAKDEINQSGAAKEACVGAGGLPAPDRSTLLALAGLVHRELLARPILALTNVLQMRLTHAVEDALIPSPIFPEAVFAVRRNFAAGPEDQPAAQGGAAAPAGTVAAPAGTAKGGRADFLNATVAEDWSFRLCEEGATGALFGGSVRFDPATTSGLLIEANSAGPFDEYLDPGRGRSEENKARDLWDARGGGVAMFGFSIDDQHRVTFPRSTVLALRLEGLPLPDDGRAGERTYRLEQLLALAWSNGPDRVKRALRAYLPAAFTHNGARRIRLRAVPLNRHAGLMPAGGKRPADPDLSAPVWIPATVRPSAPIVDHVSLSLERVVLPMRVGANGTFTVGIRQRTRVRLWLARPLFGSGEEERIGVVLWPPGLFARGSVTDARGQPLLEPGAEFLDEDLGPGGAFVTRWAADPLSPEPGPDGGRVEAFVDPDRISGGHHLVPRAFMPVPVSAPPWGADGSEADTNKGSADASGAGTQNPVAAAPATFLEVALHTFDPRFDPLEELWYVDIELRTDPLPFPRVRLGLVRYQPHAREDDLPPEGEEPVRLRVSAPTVQWVKPLPGRTATATCRRRADGTTEIVVVVSGPTGAEHEGGPKSAGGEAEPLRSGQSSVEVEIIRYRVLEGVSEEEVAFEADGCSQASCRTWSSDPTQKGKGYTERTAEGRAWTCMFVLAGEIEQDGWSHAAIVHEARSFERATTEQNQRAWGEAGPHFIARLPLTQTLPKADPLASEDGI